MKSLTAVALVLGSACALLPGSLQISAQVCKDEEGMVTDYKQAVTELVATVKKESPVDFEKSFHQKTVMTKLTLLGSMVDGLVSCLEKRVGDPAILQEDSTAAKGKLVTYNKLKDTIKQDREALKAAQSGKEAKAVIEKFVFTP